MPQLLALLFREAEKDCFRRYLTSISPVMHDQSKDIRSAFETCLGWCATQPTCPVSRDNTKASILPPYVQQTLQTGDHGAFQSNLSLSCVGFQIGLLALISFVSRNQKNGNSTSRKLMTQATRLTGRLPMPQQPRLALRTRRSSLLGTS